MSRTNAGYEIISSIPIGDGEIVLGKKPTKSIVPYVTWHCRNHTHYPTVQTISADNPTDTVIKRIINGAECWLSLSKDEVTEVCSKQAIKDTICDIEYRIGESDTLTELNEQYPLSEAELTAIADRYLLMTISRRNSIVNRRLPNRKPRTNVSLKCKENS